MDKKQNAGEKAVEWIRDNSNIGLGTGSTVYYTILKLGEMVKEGLNIRAIATSSETASLASKVGIPLTTFSDVQQLDLTIDGADAVTPNLNVIKGGGGALLREKLVAMASKRFIIIVDDSKLVSTFDGCSIPVEIVPFAWETTARRIETLGGMPVLRRRDDTPVITDNQNMILDTVFESISDPELLNRNLKNVTGVVETGLFVNMADIVIVGGESETDVIYRSKVSE